MDTDTLLNDFATRSFRDTADLDYISARMSFRAGLIEQFHWQSLQTLEKYLKAILLYNRIKARRVGHSLSKALEKAKQLPFKLELTRSASEFVTHLDTYGRFRYLEASYFVHGAKLLELDRTVWEIRRYCKVLNYEISRTDGSKKQMLPVELEAIDRSKSHAPQQFRILGGALESIIDKRDHPARAPLIWQNGFFGKKKRRSVKARVVFQAKNSPLTLHPEILHEVSKYIYLPKEVVDAYSVRS